MINPSTSKNVITRWESDQSETATLEILHRDNAITLTQVRWTESHGAILCAPIISYHRSDGMTSRWRRRWRWGWRWCRCGCWTWASSRNCWVTGIISHTTDIALTTDFDVSSI